MFGNHSLGGLLKEGTHEKSPKCLSGNLGDFGEFCKGLGLCKFTEKRVLMPLSVLDSNLEDFTKVSAFLFL